MGLPVPLSLPQLLDARLTTTVINVLCNFIHHTLNASPSHLLFPLVPSSPLLAEIYHRSLDLYLTTGRFLHISFPSLVLVRRTIATLFSSESFCISDTGIMYPRLLESDRYNLPYLFKSFSTCQFGSLVWADNSPCGIDETFDLTLRMDISIDNGRIYSGLPNTRVWY